MHHRTGIKAGFVKLDSAYASVLRAIHLWGGKARAQDIVEETGLPVKEVTTYLHRLYMLEEHRYVFRHGKACIYDTGDKTQFIYGLEPSDHRKPYRMKISAERQARLREKQKGHTAFNSIFSIGKHDFEIKIK